MDEQAARVVVTGASSGIGLATGLDAAGRGDHLVLPARGAAALADAVEQCRVAGRRPRWTCPPTSPTTQRCSGRSRWRPGGTAASHAVVHCAGLVAYGRLEDVPAAVFDRVVQTNLLGSVDIARAVLPGMRERNAETLVLIGSLIGHIAPPYLSACAVSTWGRARARPAAAGRERRP